MTGTDLDAHASELTWSRTPFVRAMVVRAERPTSAKPGDRAILLADGSIDGFVGGACAEATVRLHGLRLLESGESTLLRISPGTSIERAGEGYVEVANPCLSGGTLEIFLETVIPVPLVLVFGDTPVARALTRIGIAMDYQITEPADATAPIPPDAAAVVVASHGRDEEPMLTAALRADVPYVALVASRRRGPAVIASLAVNDEQRARVRTPAGLDIAAHTPPDVALSILAQIIATREPTAGAKPVMETDTDPVCGMSVAVADASLRAEHAGRTWYFCSPGCRSRFVDDPGRFAA
jgi:xanthine dehydrogenase accessory factor